MGKMKEIFMAQQQEAEYNENQDMHIAQSFIKVDQTPCPNCFKSTLLRNETEALCEGCGQGFDFIGTALRFK
jgi:hypothetical protein